ncbi:MAG: hypothetical protein M3472_02990 [Chloroflexota bacterium]|nr:hypothetical protein [Chloroflexota bacterium]
MDQAAVREHAQAHCDALLAGDVDAAAAELSEELRSNIGPLLAQLPLPLTEATVESIEQGGTAFICVLRLVGENEEIRLQTRWKERDGRPTIVEASRISDATPEVGAAVPGSEEAEEDSGAG